MVYKNGPHKIDDSELPIASSAFKAGVQEHLRRKLLESHSVKRDTGTIRANYSGDMLEVRALSGKPFYVLVEGIPQKLKDSFVDSIPTKWSVKATSLPETRYCCFVIFPKVEAHMKVDENQMRNLSISDINVRAWRINEDFFWRLPLGYDIPNLIKKIHQKRTKLYAFPLDPIGRQALVKSFPGWNWVYQDEAIYANDVWKPTIGIRQIDLTKTDGLGNPTRHPFIAIGALLNGVFRTAEFLVASLRF